MPDADIQIVFITAPDAAQGQAIAEALVRERLAACVNLISGVESVYRWEGQVQKDAEVLLVVKTRQDRCKALEERVLELHPYDVPEVLAIPVTSGSAPYLNWVAEESRA